MIKVAGSLREDIHHTADGTPFLTLDHSHPLIFPFEMTQKGALAGCWNHDLGLPASGAGKEYVPVVWVTPSVDPSWHPLYLNCRVGRTLSLRTAVGRGRGDGEGAGWGRTAAIRVRATEVWERECQEQGQGG